MTTVLVTGAEGFMGRNLCVSLKERDDVSLIAYDLKSAPTELERGLSEADVIYHLAGVNRPQDTTEFETGNAGFTRDLVTRLRRKKRSPRIIMTSSIQADLDNPYGVSKRQAEEELHKYAEQTGASVYVYRLTNAFGKWSKPYYNSVVATFCHQAAREEGFTINDPDAMVTFVYIDDIVRSLTVILDGSTPLKKDGFYTVTPQFSVSIGQLAGKLTRIAAVRNTGIIPDFTDTFDKYLYSTYLSYLASDSFAYSVEKKSDNRGYLFELIKSPHAGQVFVSRTLPGITRGNHYHHTKVEKFCVVDGTARIAFRHIVTGERVEYTVEGTECRVVDIPPGWTHNITNTGNKDLVTIFWANEIFDPGNPDTTYTEV